MNSDRNIIFVITFICFSLVLLLSARTSFAQITNPVDKISFEQTPENPSPGEKVTIDIKSYSIDLNRSSISWYQDKKLIDGTDGKTQIVTKAPVLGKTSDISVIVKTLDGGTITRSLILKSSDIDLIVETDGFVPPFYAGKAMPVYQNRYRFIAVPHFVGTNGKEVDPKTLIYEWKQDYKVLGDQSGYGRDVLTLKAAIVPKPLVITVKASSQTGNMQGERLIQIDPTKPSVLTYREDPLYGVLYNKLIDGSLRLSDSEAKVVAVPFGFSNIKNLLYNWNVNGKEMTDLSVNRSIVLRRSTDAAGSSDISIEARNQDEILQGTDASFRILFGKKTSGVGAGGEGRTVSNPF